jgi:hypothetical protein
MPRLDGPSEHEGLVVGEIDRTARRGIRDDTGYRIRLCNPRVESSPKSHDEHFGSRWAENPACENALRRTISTSGYIEVPPEKRV